MLTDNNYNPTIGSVGGKYRVIDLDSTDATTGQTPSFDGTAVVWSTPIATSALPSAEIFVGNVSNVATAVAMSGDASISNTGAVSVSDLTITSQTTGDILYFNGVNWVHLPIGTTGQVLTVSMAGIPSWA